MAKSAIKKYQHRNNHGIGGMSESSIMAKIMAKAYIAA
jgi:hypothetical protein